MDQLRHGEVRPQYISTFQIKCNTVAGSVCYRLCDAAILDVRGEDGNFLYYKEKTYRNIALETWETESGDVQVIDKEYPIYRLHERYEPW